MDFDTALEFVLKWEGMGCHHDPNDPGGLTCFGLAKRFNPEVREGMTLAEARDIYYRRYWLACGAPALPGPLAAAHFDTAVNLGVPKARELLAEAQGDVERYLALRLHYYTTREGWPRYGKGWTRRVADLLTFIDQGRVGKRLKLHQDGEFVQAYEIPAGKRVVVALEPTGDVNLDVR